MVQIEGKKKLRVYVATAFLIAIVLLSVIYVLEFAPMPSTNPPISPVASAMKTFSSYENLKNYLNANLKGTTGFGGGPLDQSFLNAQSRTALGEAAPTTSDSGGQSNLNSFSTTNIQVAGVDEADTTKTDGIYIYTVSNDYSAGNYIYIVKADPNNSRVVSKIRLENDTYLAGMFLSSDSTKLVVIGSQYQIYALAAGDARVPSVGVSTIYPFYNEVKTFVKVYDISDKVNPTLSRNFTLSGSYFNSRMIGDYVYTIVSQSAYIYQNAVPLPTVYTKTGQTEIPATDVYYSDASTYNFTESNYFTFTSFYGLNLKESSDEITNMTVLMGGASTMYVSLNNIYVTYPTWSYSDGQFTSIYRVSIDNGNFTFQAKGGVAGNVLNQYSMDEFNDYFRLATTNWKDTTQNVVYVLDMNLTTVGALELKSEVREVLQSARFIGNRAYIVTFEQKDPFFVLDMSNPASPTVAGELEIPGYSSYLHPYDENHIIGLGMENSSVKLSLFDVTKVNAPVETAKYIVNGDYSYSQALSEPKAFLFDKAKELLVIPVSIMHYGVVSGGGVVPSEAGDITSSPTIAQGSYWDGAYVFKLTVAGGFEFRGTITHQNDTTQQYWYGDYNLMINRALYINNTLYTISNAEVKLNSLTDLTQIAEVKLN